jgi:cytosine/adenosine deaminase-related metal-dependent hydrolase
MQVNRILIKDAAYVITMDEKRRIISGGSILIENDRIAAVDKAIDVSQVDVDTVIEAKDMVIT